jgi:hypothetical protein
MELLIEQISLAHPMVMESIAQFTKQKPALRRNS